MLLESAVRNCDNFAVREVDVENILAWKSTSAREVEIPFKPGRVVLQDFTGVSAVVDLAAMRDAAVKLGLDPRKLNPVCPADLVIDHSVQLDSSRLPDSLRINEKLEFDRNLERFEFLKWAQGAFRNFQVLPPGSGILHQVNMEHLARVVIRAGGLLYPDSVVGTDSHTTMINGLGVVGWGVGSLEAEAVMLGLPISMLLPEVVGFKLTGRLSRHVNCTDLALTITNLLRRRNVVGKFVEFFGDGCANLSLEDRATVANMGPEYGATMGYFPVDYRSLEYLSTTGRDPELVRGVRSYLHAQGLFRTYDGRTEDPDFSGPVLELDLAEVTPSLAGPKRPHDRVDLSDMRRDFRACLGNPVGFKGFGLPPNRLTEEHRFVFKGKSHTLRHGSIVIAAIASSTNTSNPGAMLSAGLLAKAANEAGLSVAPYIKTSLSPGSKAVTKYLEAAGVQEHLEQLGFYTAGYGCMTCIGNSGELDKEVAELIVEKDLVVSAVLSGNRNFEGRVHPLTRANYLASPPLVVAYALAGRLDIDFEAEPLGTGRSGKPVFLRDLWPSQEKCAALIEQVLTPELYRQVYSDITRGTPRWNEMRVRQQPTFNWKLDSTYIRSPPYFANFSVDRKPVPDIRDAYCLLNLGDCITTDHMSPAGKITKGSPAAEYLSQRLVQPEDFDIYGARRGNFEIVARGAFANARLLNKLVGKVAPKTLHVPTGQIMSIFDAASEYKAAGLHSIILAGKEYGLGSSRDSAAKGPYLLGVRAVIAQSFERIHRSNLLGVGVLPLQFLNGESADALGLTGCERFSIELKGGNLKAQEVLPVKTSSGLTLYAKACLETEVEAEYFKNGGILHYILRQLVSRSQIEEPASDNH